MKAVEIRFLVLILLGLSVLVLAMVFLASIGGQAQNPLYEASLRQCCSNWCAVGDSANCNVPKQFDDTGKMTVTDLAAKVGIESTNLADRMNSICNCG